jgi:hypothetical protein
MNKRAGILPTLGVAVAGAFGATFMGVAGFSNVAIAQEQTIKHNSNDQKILDRIKDNFEGYVSFEITNGVKSYYTNLFESSLYTMTSAENPSVLSNTDDYGIPDNTAVTYECGEIAKVARRLVEMSGLLDGIDPEKDQVRINVILNSYSYGFDSNGREGSAGRMSDKMENKTGFIVISGSGSGGFDKLRDAIKTAMDQMTERELELVKQGYLPLPGPERNHVPYSHKRQCAVSKLPDSPNFFASYTGGSARCPSV